jgi:hypothetical protein
MHSVPFIASFVWCDTLCGLEHIAGPVFYVPLLLQLLSHYTWKLRPIYPYTAGYLEKELVHKSHCYTLIIGRIALAEALADDCGHGIYLPILYIVEEDKRKFMTQVYKRS